MAVEYKCENCAASLRFDAQKNMLLCDYCGSEFSVEYVEDKVSKQQEEKTKKEASDEENWKEDYDKNSDESFEKMRVKVRTCPSCGGTLLGDENSAATFCTYCGNATLTDAVITDTRVPDYIIPFKKTKEEAQKAFLEWGKKGFITPRDFTSKSTVDKITGLYVPFYLYSCISTCDYFGKAEKVYDEYKFGKKVEITEHYSVARNITAKFKDIPADASEKMNDNTMDLLEPFDFDELEEFKKAYMSGFFADKYSYTDKELVERVAKRVIDYSVEAAEDTINGYTTTSKTGAKTDITWHKTKYAMLPVWILNYNYNGANYEFVMNGQTGRTVGERPSSGWRATLLFLIWFVCSFVVLTIISLFFTFGFAPFIGFFGALIISIFPVISAYHNQKSVMTTSGIDYKFGKTTVNSHSDRFVKKTKRVVDDD